MLNSNPTGLLSVEVSTFTQMQLSYDNNLQMISLTNYHNLLRLFFQQSFILVVVDLKNFLFITLKNFDYSLSSNYFETNLLLKSVL